MALFVFLAFLLSEIPLSSALTEEQRLRAAISNPAATSFKLASNIVLTSDLPPFTITSGKARKFKVYSNSGLSISGANKYRGFRTVNAIIASLVFPNFELTFDNVKLLNFVTPASHFPDKDGAAIGVRDTAVNILNSVISGCKGERGNGAVYMSASMEPFVNPKSKKSPLTIRNSKFLGNTGIGGAAVLYEAGGVLTITNSVFSDNRATGPVNIPYGGALDVTSGPVATPAIIKITSTTFKNNVAGRGGAIRILYMAGQPSKPPVFTSCYFEANTATDSNSAGAIDLYGVKEIQLIKTTYNGNYAGGGTIPSVIYVTRYDGDPVTKIRVASGPFPVVLTNSPGSFVIV